MDVQEFFELSAGKWFSQKTSHHLTLKQSAHGKSDLVIDILPSDDPQVQQLCQQANVDATQIWGGAKYSWTGIATGEERQQTAAAQQGSAVAILVPDVSGARTGNLLRMSEGAATVTARYTLGRDNALTLVTEAEQTRAEERIWFESDNVRLRTTLATGANGDALAAFYTEIRMGKRGDGK